MQLRLPQQAVLVDWGVPWKVAAAEEEEDRVKAALRVLMPLMGQVELAALGSVSIILTALVVLAAEAKKEAQAMEQAEAAPDIRVPEETEETSAAAVELQITVVEAMAVLEQAAAQAEQVEQIPPVLAEPAARELACQPAAAEAQDLAELSTSNKTAFSLFKTALAFPVTRQPLELVARPPAESMEETERRLDKIFLSNREAV